MAFPSAKAGLFCTRSIPPTKLLGRNCKTILTMVHHKRNTVKDKKNQPQSTARPWRQKSLLRKRLRSMIFLQCLGEFRSKAHPRAVASPALTIGLRRIVTLEAELHLICVSYGNPGDHQLRICLVGTGKQKGFWVSQILRTPIYWAT